MRTPDPEVAIRDLFPLGLAIASLNHGGSVSETGPLLNE